MIITKAIEREARRLIRSETEIICLDKTSYIFYLMIGLDEAKKGHKTAKIKYKN